jgi:pimeloyl-ACP methyl ester carboxylesterase
MWRDLGAALGHAGYRAIAPSQRGYSARARPSETQDYAVENLLSDALGIMDAMEAARFHVVGHDWGGHLSWLLAAYHPRRVTSLSVMSRPHPAAFVRALEADPGQRGRSKHHRAFLGDNAIQEMRATNLATLRASLLSQHVAPRRVESYLSTLLEPGAIEGAMSWYRARSSLESAKTPPVSTPTLYIWGRQDTTVGAFAALATAEYVTGAYTFEALDRGMHYIVDQFPDRVRDLVVGHLLRFPQRRRSR